MTTPDDPRIPRTTITRRTSIDPDLPDWFVWLLDRRWLLLGLAAEVVTLIGVAK